MIEMKAALEASFGQQCCGHDQEFVFFLGTELHGKPWSTSVCRRWSERMVRCEQWSLQRLFL